MPPRKSYYSKPKSSCIILLASFLFILTLLFTFLNSTPPSHHVIHTPPHDAPPKPKIYMYDLPTKFTLGVVDSYARARGGPKPGEEGKYPGNQHMGEWHLFTDLNLPGPDRVGSPVERVMDPEEADLFYVPFFSSLSLVANPIRPGGGASGVHYSDEQMQVSISDVFSMRIVRA